MNIEGCEFPRRDDLYRVQQAERLQGYLSALRDMKSAMLEGTVMVELWDMLTALRGCDTDNRELKILTTARLRGFLGLRAIGCDIASYPLPIGKRERRDQLLNVAPEHFRNHFLWAVMAVWLAYGYNLLTEQDEQGREHGTYRELLDGMDTGNVS